jgi:hypothetical protein
VRRRHVLVYGVNLDRTELPTVTINILVVVGLLHHSLRVFLSPLVLLHTHTEIEQFHYLYHFLVVMLPHHLISQKYHILEMCILLLLEVFITMLLDSTTITIAVFGCTELRLRIELSDDSKSKLERK